MMGLIFHFTGEHNCRIIKIRHPRESGAPVRRGLSIQPLPSLEYWIPAFAEMTVGVHSRLGARR